MSDRLSSQPAAFKTRALEQHGYIDLLGEGALETQKAVLAHAAAIGINRTYTGEKWPDMCLRLIDYRATFPELATDAITADSAKRRAVYGAMSGEAERLGIKTWANMNVANYPDAFTRLFPEAIATPPVLADRWCRQPGPRGLSKQPQVCPSSAPFRKLMTAQLTELCRLPNVHGVECWLTAGDSDLFYCACQQCGSKSISDLIVEFAQLAHDVCRVHDKGLVLRCYLGGWRCALETEVWREVGPRIHPDIEIVYKQQQGDFMNWHGPNPLAGQLSPHPEQVELDLAGEYRGTNYGMVCTVRWQMQELLRHFREQGVAHIACRGIDGPHFFDLDKWIFGALAQDPDLDVAAWSCRWAQERFGEAGDEVLAILDECAKIMRLTMYVRGVQWASWAVPQNLARLRFILFDRSVPCVPGSFARLEPTEQTIRLLVEEKQAGLQRAEQLVLRCANLEGKLDDRPFKSLRASVTYLRMYASITGPLLETFFHFLAWGKTPSEVAREYIRLPMLSALEIGRCRIEEALREVRAMDLAVLIPISTGTGFVDEKAHDKYLEPYRNALKILDDIAKESDTESASWWAYYPTQERWPENIQQRPALFQAPTLVDSK